LFKNLVSLDRSGAVPLGEQIYRQIRIAIRDGIIRDGYILPSSRAMSEQLGVSRNTATHAYELLKAEAIVSVRAGAAPRVNAPMLGSASITIAKATPSPKSGLSKRGRRFCSDLRQSQASSDDGILQPGVPDHNLFPREAWASCLRRASRQLSGKDTLYTYVTGLPRLQQTLARYLAQTRGVIAAPEQILVTPSTQASLTLLVQCLSDPGDTALLEEPGYLGARGAFQNGRLTVLPLAVDDNGARVPAEGKLKNARFIYLTPSHQYPLGHVLPLDRRLAFTAMAKQSGTYILEDDYDSEFLFTDYPVASMQGLGAGSEIIYLATFAKTMLPGLKLAYMVIPPELVSPLSLGARNLGLAASVTVQAAMSDFIESGQYRAHLRKICIAYKERGDALFEVLSKRLGGLVSMSRPSGGVQMSIRFAQPMNDEAAAIQLQSMGINVSPLSMTYMAQEQSGLIVGFSDAVEANLVRGTDAIVKILTS